MDAPQLMRCSTCIVVVYSITDSDSFSAASNLLEEIHEELSTKHANPPVVVLIGNKCDLEHKREVTCDDGQRLADNFGIAYYETTASEEYNSVFRPFSSILTRSLIASTGSKTLRNFDKTEVVELCEEMNESSHVNLTASPINEAASHVATDRLAGYRSSITQWRKLSRKSSKEKDKHRTRSQSLLVPPTHERTSSPTTQPKKTLGSITRRISSSLSLSSSRSRPSSPLCSNPSLCSSSSSLSSRSVSPVQQSRPISPLAQPLGEPQGTLEEEEHIHKDSHRNLMKNRSLQHDPRHHLESNTHDLNSTKSTMSPFTRHRKMCLGGRCRDNGCRRSSSADNILVQKIEMNL